ncbi:hypothetical protein SOVF_148560 [Spinacia oleracea]|nr:hypothetical protein SOVF_148560 [Spinacia oleracea]
MRAFGTPIQLIFENENRSLESDDTEGNRAPRSVEREKMVIIPRFFLY